MIRSKFRRPLAITVAFASLGIGSAVAGSTWALTLEGDGYGAFLGAALVDSGIIAVGATNHRHMPPYSGDALFVWVDLEGRVLAEKTWGGRGYEQAHAVLEADDGGLLIFGETDSYGAGDRNFFLLRTESGGGEIWMKTYGSPWREWPYGMLELENGDLLLYGRTQSRRNGPEDRYAVRVTRSGAVVWEYAVARGRDEIVLDALELPTGEILLCLIRDQDPLLIQLDENGEEQWLVHHRLPGWQFASGIASATDDELFLAGFQMSSDGSSQVDVWLARADEAGSLLWETSFGRRGQDDYAHKLVALSDGGFLIAGLGHGLPLFKIDALGDVIWEARPGREAVYATGDVLELENGDLIIPAMIQLDPGRSYNPVLFRLNAEGQLTP